MTSKERVKETIHVAYGEKLYYMEYYLLFDHKRHTENYSYPHILQKGTIKRTDFSSLHLGFSLPLKLM